MIKCCPLQPNSHPQCYPILVPKDDPFYGGYEEDCLNFVRTAMCPQCKLGKCEPNCVCKHYVCLSVCKLRIICNGVESGYDIYIMYYSRVDEEKNKTNRVQITHSQGTMDDEGKEEEEEEDNHYIPPI